MTRTHPPNVSKEQREELLRRFNALSERLAQQNQDLSAEEAERIAVRAGREINQTLYERWRQRMRDRDGEGPR